MAFVNKLNYNESGTLVSDETASIALPGREWELQHDNVLVDKGITVRTSPNGGGSVVTDYTIQTGSESWKTKLVFGAYVSAGVYYISYYSQGDMNDANDLNTVAGSVSILQDSLITLQTSVTQVSPDISSIKQSITAIQSSLGQLADISANVQPITDIVQSILDVQQSLSSVSDFQTDMQTSIMNSLDDIKILINGLGTVTPTNPDSTPPENVTGLMVSATTSTSMTLTWIPSTSIDISSYKVYNGATLVGVTSNSTYTVTALTDNTTYTFVVKSQDISGNISNGVSVTGKTQQVADITPPTEVTSLVATNQTTTSIDLSWIASTSPDINSYKVYNGTTLLTATASTSCTITGLVSGTNYTFTIKGVDVSGNVSVGMSVSTSTLQGDITPPNEVLGFKTISVGTNSVGLSWNASTSGDIKDYQLYQDNTLLATISATTYTVTGLSPSSQYTFLLKSRDLTGNISNGVTLTVTTSSLDVTAPSNVTNLSSSNVTETSLMLTWTASTSPDIASYDLYNGGTFLINVVGTSFTVTGLTAKTNYSFTVKSKDTTGNVSSGLSINVMTADTTPPANVASLMATSTASNSISLSWAASTSPDIQDYQVYNNGILVSTVSATTFTITGLTASTTYTVTVKARDNAGNISSGSSITATTAVAPDITAPPNVANLQYNNLTDRSVYLTWSAVSANDLASYDIYNGSTFIVSTNSTEYTVTGLSANTNYTIYVKSKDTSNNVSTGSSVTFTTLATSGATTIDGGAFTDTPSSTVDAGTFTDTNISSTIDGGVF